MSFAKAEDLLNLAAMAAGRRGVSLEEIVDRFNCSYRTAQRMLVALENAFPDVASATGDDGRKRWRMQGGHLRELMTLKPEELAALDFAISHLGHAGHDADARLVLQLRDKMLSLVPRTTIARIEPDHEALLEAQGFVARPGPKPKWDPVVAEAISEAIKGCQVLEIDYRGYQDEDARVRRIEPYGVLSGVRRYLVGRPVEDGEGPVRSYRLEAIEAVRVTTEMFLRPDGFDLQRFANRAFGVYQRDDEYGEIVWRFRSDAAGQARGYQFHPEQELEEQTDGSLVVRFRAAGHLEMCWHLYSWGDRVEVLAPEALRKMVEGHRRGDFPAMP
ncbi:putative DNA-binding transcriptional regulator YafY [Rhodoligotrophos appendicifer]|uniref:helix-turn-helix transcriptional regulator n=1 Tax=Rhodoligotrophos appendicifer TaxID=987056 RepID=UPI001186009F|nr:WYL domain-containing protein [Rhodoligotrophos appendicifer]